MANSAGMASFPNPIRKTRSSLLPRKESGMKSIKLRRARAMMSKFVSLPTMVAVAAAIEAENVTSGAMNPPIGGRLSHKTSKSVPTASPIATLPSAHPMTGPTTTGLDSIN